MPGGDRTGPMEMGPMTGRGAGYCAGYTSPGFNNDPAWGRSFGAGFGRGGRGRRNMFYATGQPGWMRSGGYAMPYQKPDPEIEKQALKSQAEALQSNIDLIKKRLSELEAEAAVK